MHASRTHFRLSVGAFGRLMLLAALWLAMRGYQGLTGDAQIYAFQALSRLRPYLAHDLYLVHTSQDQFTIFSPFYAFFIGWMGLESAARLLTLVFTAWLLGSAWRLARQLSNAEYAWLAVGSLLIFPLDYGASGVFSFSQPFLTARLPAEALVATALACQVGGRALLAYALAAAALVVHPLIAFPACLILMGLALPPRIAACVAACGVVATAAFAVVVAIVHPGARLFALMDAPWLNVVRERSQFLFLDLWTLRDWDLNARPLCSLAFTWLVVGDGRVRKLCAVTALVAAAGFAVALVGGSVGPVAILLQGQAWRWIWIAVFLSVLLLPITASAAWRDQPCGPFCVLLVLAGWIIFDDSACVAAGLVVWTMRSRLGPRAAAFFRFAAPLLGVGAAVWLLVKTRGILEQVSGRPSTASTIVRSIFALKMPAFLLGLLCFKALRSARWVPPVVCAALIAFSFLVLPGAFKQWRPLDSPAEIEQYSGWINAIPPSSTVLIAPAVDVDQFVWFTLGRLNYLSVDQSAGVVFARETALEVERRSRILLPVMNQNWKLRTALQASASGERKAQAGRPLTAASLAQVCGDPKLGFVIAPQEVGFEPIPHTGPGSFKGWNLYDCDKVRPKESI
jgi:hypothetical protein